MKEFEDFMSEYVSFLEKMVTTEERKLRALSANKLKEIQEAVSAAQANDMQLQNFERRREQMQEELGLAGKTFRQIVEQANGEDGKRLKTLFQRMQQALDKIKFLNGKSMEIARTNMKLNHLLGAEPVETPARFHSYGAQPGPAGKPGLLETKA